MPPGVRSAPAGRRGASRPPTGAEARAALGERDREVGIVAVFGDLLAAAEDAVAFGAGVLVLDDVGRPDHGAGELLDTECDRNDVAVGRGRDRGVAEARALDVRPARAEQEAAEDRAGRGADRAEEVAARDRQAEGADGGNAGRDHQFRRGFMVAATLPGTNGSPRKFLALPSA